jgi:hypothetical protein
MENQFKFPAWSKIQRRNIFMDLSRTLRFLRSHIEKDFLKREMDSKISFKSSIPPESYFKLKEVDLSKICGFQSLSFQTSLMLQEHEKSRIDFAF